MIKLNKAGLIERIAEKIGSTKKEAEVFLNAKFEVEDEVLASGGSIQIVGRGTLSAKYKKPTEAKEVPNPQNRDEMIPVSAKPAKMVAHYKIGKSLHEAALKAPVVEPVK